MMSVTATSVRAHPKQVNSYTIIALIDEGGMGAVYKAEQALTKRSVALKLIRADRLSDQMREQFTNEFQLLASVTHPGIAQLYEAGEAIGTDGVCQPFFTMELVRGSRLTHRADEMAMSIADRLKLMVKILEAIHHAHLQGIVHLDLKPSNILIDEAGHPKILDFGVALKKDQNARACDNRDRTWALGIHIGLYESRANRPPS